MSESRKGTKNTVLPPLPIKRFRLVRTELDEPGQLRHLLLIPVSGKDAPPDRPSGHHP